MRKRRIGVREIKGKEDEGIMDRKGEMRLGKMWDREKRKRTGDRKEGKGENETERKKKTEDTEKKLKRRKEIQPKEGAKRVL